MGPALHEDGGSLSEAESVKAAPLIAGWSAYRPRSVNSFLIRFNAMARVSGGM